MSRPSYSTGNALAEYGLIALLVACGAVVALMTLGNTVNGMFSGMLSRKEPQIIQAVDASGTMAPVPGIANPAAPDLASDPSPCQAWDPAGLRNRVLTLGANGTTEYLASQMKAAIQNYVAEGKLSPEQASLLLELSNRGHEMARIEALVEQAYQVANGDKETYKAAIIPYNGKNYSAGELIYMVALGGAYANLPDPLNPPANVSQGPAMKAFVSLYHQAEASGALNDPEVARAIQGFASQIARIGEVADCTFYFDDSWPSPDAFKEEPDAVNTVMASKITDVNSVGICTTSGNRDSGTQCSSR